MKFQTLKLSAQSSPSVAPEAQKPAIVTGPLTRKAKQMPVRRGDVYLRDVNTYSARVHYW